MKFLNLVVIGALVSCLLSTLAAADASASAYTSSIALEDGDCKKEIRKQCGEEIDELKKQAQKTSVLGTLKAVTSVVQCLVEKSQKIAGKCFSGESIDKTDLESIEKTLSERKPIFGSEEEDCQDSIMEKCGYEFKTLQTLLENGASPREIVRSARDIVKCLVNNEKDIIKDCTHTFSNVAIPLPTPKKPVWAEEESNCHKVLHKKCGKQLDNLKDAIEEVSVLEILKFAFESVSCITQNVEEIFKECKKDVKDSTPSNPAINFQPAPPVQRPQQEGKCHKAVHDVCGDEISELKKALDNSNPSGVVSSSLELAGCLTENFVKLTKACSPFEIKGEQVLMSPPRDAKSSHFDFYDCVQMAKKALHEDWHNQDGELRDSHHRHGLFIFVLIAIVSLSFAKGYCIGKGYRPCARLCCRRNQEPAEDADGKLQYKPMIEAPISA